MNWSEEAQFKCSVVGDNCLVAGKRLAGEDSGCGSAGLKFEGKREEKHERKKEA